MRAGLAKVDFIFYLNNLYQRAPQMPHLNEMNEILSTAQSFHRWRESSAETENSKTFSIKKNKKKIESAKVLHSFYHIDNFVFVQRRLLKVIQEVSRRKKKTTGRRPILLHLLLYCSQVPKLKYECNVMLLFFDTFACYALESSVPFSSPSRHVEPISDKRKYHFWND